MKKIIAFTFTLVFFMACKKENKEEALYASFGKEIVSDDAVKASSMAKHYKTMRVGDSINSKMVAKVNEVCQAKGCWMTLALEDSTEVLVRFKDYGFFVPKNIAGKEVIVNGQAFIAETSVEELRHYAKDAGEPQEEIDKITEPKRTLSFLADGVLVKE